MFISIYNTSYIIYHLFFLCHRPDRFSTRWLFTTAGCEQPWPQLPKNLKKIWRHIQYYGGYEALGSVELMVRYKRSDGDERAIRTSRHVFWHIFSKRKNRQKFFPLFCKIEYFKYDIRNLISRRLLSTRNQVYAQQKERRGNSIGISFMSK